MLLRRERICRTLLAAALTCALASPVGASPTLSASETFAADSHTLFLVTFDAGLDAVVARGDPRAISGNAAFAEGPTGRGILPSLRHRPGGNDTPVFELPFFRMVEYDPDRNLDPQRGTLEMWIKPMFGGTPPLSYIDPLKEPNAEDYHRYFLFHCYVTAGNRHFGLYIREHKEHGYNEVVFHEMWSRGDLHEHADDDENWFLVAEASPLEGERWHHVAVTWTPRKRALFVDGEKRASRVAEGPLPTPPMHRAFAIGSLATYSDQPAEAVIDQVRISDIVRYEDDFEVVPE